MDIFTCKKMKLCSVNYVAETWVEHKGHFYSISYNYYMYLSYNAIGSLV